ncbi:MAG TPA: hypothetical protein VFJ03_03020 [Candidatus Limnocylindria bacterium]|jgi:hypothetical protein|nr:hypothetical protein [Candidatus Limnocylindria bacterium]
MQYLGFIVAGYGVILGGVLLYAVTLLRRLAKGRRMSLDIRRRAEAATLPSDPPA